MRGWGWLALGLVVVLVAVAPKIAAAKRLEAVRLQGLALMDAPRDGSKMLRVLRAGETVTVVGRQGVWVEVLLANGAKGFVHGGFLTGFPDIAPIAAYAARMDPGVTRPAQPSEADAAVAPAAANPVSAPPAAVKPVSLPPAAVKPVSVPPAAAKPVSAPPTAAKPVEAASTAPRPAVATKTVAPLPAGQAPYVPVADGGGVAGFLDALVRPKSIRAGQAAATPPEHKSRYFIEVHLAAHQLFLFENMPDGSRRLVHQYLVAVPGKDMEAPQGWGVVTGISFEPWWYPTPAMKARAKKKGKTLPNFVKPGVKANPMGTFKIILSHGDGFRIHGNNNPGSIGHSVTSGCIRMRNEEGRSMAKMIDVGTEVVFSQ